MTRIVLVGIAALALAAGLPSVAGAFGQGDVAGPTCADVVSGDGNYLSSGAVNVSVELAAPSCSYVTYTIYVLDASGTTQLGSQSTSGNGTDGTLQLTATVDPSNPAVCVYATTSVGRHVFDRAPDSDLPLNCVLIVQNSPPAWGSFS